MSRKILLIEDDADLRHGLLLRLRACGYEARAAGDGQQAITLAQKERPDLILLDLGLPAGDGFMVMQRLRALGVLPATPVIVLSGREVTLNRDAALEHGAVAFLGKPVNNEELLRLVGLHLGPEQAPRHEGRKVMVIEDDEDTRTGLAIRLRASGYDVIHASDATMAMTVAAREMPDAILLDLGLPGGDGFMLLERFKAHVTLSAVPVIVISARDPVFSGERCLKAGAVEFLQKPADNARIVATLRKAMGG